MIFINYGDLHVSKESVEGILEQVEEDDPLTRETLRQLAASNILQKDLVPLITSVKDDPDLFYMVIRLLGKLTKPIECLQQEVGKSGQHSSDTEATSIMLPWIPEIETMLTKAAESCTDKRFIQSIFVEVNKIVKDAGQYDLIDSDCEAIKECLLLLRNILHIPKGNKELDQTDLHFTFLRLLLECGLEEVLLLLLNSKQKDAWGVVIVQLISLLYRDLASEIFLTLEDATSCEADSCDSATCSYCESIMDRNMFFPVKMGMSQDSSSYDMSASGDQKTKSQCSGSEERLSRSSESGSADKNSISPVKIQLMEKHTNESDSLILQSNEETSDVSTCRGLLENFDFQCDHDGMNSGDFLSDFVRGDSACTVSDNGTIQATKDQKMSISDGSQCGPLPRLSQVGPLSQLSQLGQLSRSSGSSMIDNTCMRLVEFTHSFLQGGLSNLINILKSELLQPQQLASPLDDSYYLWSIAFFLKFARRKKIKFNKIRAVLTEDVFGFLVYEAVTNGEEVQAAYKTNKLYGLPMRRLHLCVSALREMIKMMTYQLMRGLQGEDLMYMKSLQVSLANMSSLRQTFLWLVRSYQPGCHSNLYLRDVIVTNHYFLLMFEDWLAQGYCKDKEITMLNHIKQFAVPSLMLKYGQLLQTYGDNDHHVNNCAFTMMYHMAGDCKNCEVLMHPEILQTFITILEGNHPLTYEMSDLMEFIVQKFLTLSKTEPLACAVKLCTNNFLRNTNRCVMEEDDGQMSTYGWSSEEVDLLVSWWEDLEGYDNIVDEIIQRYQDRGIYKNKLEVVNQLYKMKLLTEKQLGQFIATEKAMLEQVAQREEDMSTQDQQFIAAIEELSSLEEDKVVPHCLYKLREGGYEKHLEYLQHCLLEAAYVKSDVKKDGRSQEPVSKFFCLKDQDVPIIFYNDDQETMQKNAYMVGLLEQLGINVDIDGLTYPRIPASISPAQLINLAAKIGHLPKETANFDWRAVSEDKITRLLDGTFDNGSSTSRTFKTPSVAWMKLVDSYNWQEKMDFVSIKVPNARSMDII
ncbi:protein timeless-like isoform X2 [Mya arenaria]|uniref:protein timeless-like isoform X2 n=1 Tax=Mya arenaria TaxID=6604 RepID=UPI0022E01274|nr:protein timeless-like isoform X2 [Mya arenaria]